MRAEELNYHRYEQFLEVKTRLNFEADPGQIVLIYQQLMRTLPPMQWLLDNDIRAVSLIYGLLSDYNEKQIDYPDFPRYLLGALEAVKAASAIILMTSLFRQLLVHRWDDSDDRIVADYDPSYRLSAERTAAVLRVRIFCDDYDEATLVAFSLDEFLTQFNLKKRSASGCLNIDFKRVVGGSNDQDVLVKFAFSLEDYSELRFPRQVTLGVPSFREIIDIDCEMSHFRRRSQPPSIVLQPNSRVKIVTITGLWVGKGNLGFHMRMMRRLVASMPNADFHSFIAMNGSPSTFTDESTPHWQITKSDELWEMVEMRRVLRNADLVLLMPNGFGLVQHKIQREIRGVGLFEGKRVLYVPEYHSGMAREVDAYPEMALTVYQAGFDVPSNPGSLGIIKPDRMNDSISREQLFAELMANPNLATVMGGDLDVPFYFGYLAHIKPEDPGELIGLSLSDALALYVYHARASGFSKIRIALPIENEMVFVAMQRFGHIFTDCAVTMGDRQEVNASGDLSRLEVEVLNPFPLTNNDFRRLAAYAAMCVTPVVMTGDQSLIELFFSATPRFLFLYQVLDHKQELFDALFCLAEHVGCPTIMRLLRLTKTINQFPQATEAMLILAADTLVAQQGELLEESSRLTAAVQGQPDLCESMLHELYKLVPRAFFNTTARSTAVGAGLFQELVDAAAVMRQGLEGAAAMDCERSGGSAGYRP